MSIDEKPKKVAPKKTPGDYWTEGYNAAVADRIGEHATPCVGCAGLGVKAYGSTATWRGGIGGQAITNDICDTCWGSGDASRPWLNLREYDYILYKAKNAKIV